MSPSLKKLNAKFYAPTRKHLLVSMTHGHIATIDNDWPQEVCLEWNMIISFDNRSYAG